MKEVQKLNGRITALGRFIAKSAEKCLPFFRTLKGGGKEGFEWNEDCQNAFEQIKAYLGKPPLLSSLVLGEELYVFLAATDHAVAAVLVREEDDLQKPVYYVSKALSAVEGRYLNVEKLAFALLIAARNGQSEAANKLLMTALHKNLKGRSGRWMEELSTALWVV